MAFSSSNWAQYVDQLGTRNDLIDDIEELNLSLQAKSQLLFLPTRNPLEVWRIITRSGPTATSQGLVKATGTSDDELNALFNETDKASVTILRQRSSWSQLLLSSDQFCTLMLHHKVFAAFLQVVKAFGWKDSESDVGFDGYRYRECEGENGISTQTTDSAATVRREICYRLPYPHKNGRNLVDPWSVRHSGVYMNVQSQGTPISVSTNWIMIQPASKLEKILESSMSYATAHEQPNAIETHLRFLSFTIAQWRAYLNDFTHMFESFMERASLMSCRTTDLECTINDCQTLRQVYHDRVLEVQAELLATGRIISGLKDAIEPSDTAGLGCLMHLTNQLTFLQTGFSLLLQRIIAASQLITNVMRIIERDTTVSNSQLINNIAVASKANADQSHMLHVQAVMTSNDSNFMRAAALVGIIYVPSNYIATIFQTSIVNVDNFGIKIMLFVVLSALLTGLTLAFSTWWQRRTTFRANRISGTPSP